MKSSHDRVGWLIRGGTLALAALSPPSCGGETAEAPGPPAAYVHPNYADDIAPILAKNCVRCHYTGGVSRAVMLDTFEGAAAARWHLAHVVAAREMPPWGVVASGECGSFAEHSWVPQAEINTLLAWVESGAPPGNPTPARTAEIPPPAQPKGIEVGAAYQPSIGSGVIRCFLLDSRLTGDSFLNGMSFRSPSTFGVEQVTLYSLDTEAAVTRARSLTAASPAGPDGGYPCFGEAGVEGARFLLGATRASSTIRLPPGTGVKVARDRPLVAQAHYNVFQTTSGAFSVDLELDPAAREGTWTKVGAPALALAPGAAKVDATAQTVLDRNLDVLAIYPSMRLLGRGLRLEAEIVGKRECLMNQFDWDFHWLREPRTYQKPVALRSGTRLSLTCQYTTLGKGAPVGAGETMHDEDCSVSLYTAP